MFIAMNRLRCAAEYGEHLERAFKHAGDMSSVQGCLLFQFMKHVEEDASLLYVALTQWESQSAYERWLKSESFGRAHAGTEGAAVSPVTSTLETFDVVI